VFGSVRRREADARSDLDLLVDWKRAVDLLDTAAFRRAVGEIVGRRVDVVDREFLHWAVRPQVLAEAVTV
jgi:predicted nucleotidyltransferase